MTETVQQQQPYQASTAPIGQLKSDRSLIKFILFGIITLGIYPIVFFTGLSSDLNIIASRYDGKKTMHYCLLCFLIGPITCGIAYLVWFHKISGRIGNELNRRGIPYSFGAKDYWLWAILGSLILVGPFVYTYKLAKATNALAEHYNVNG
jgi:ABC-type sulfate transport system permease subunit